VANAIAPDFSFLLSAYEIGRQIVLLDEEDDRLDRAILVLPKSKPDAELEEARRLTIARSYVPRDLLPLVRAHDLRDAAAQIIEAWRVVGFMAAFDPPGGDLTAEYRKLDRLLLSALPVVAEAASISVEEIGGDHVGMFINRAFGEEAGR
jgi:hypothetical protein